MNQTMRVRVLLVEDNPSDVAIICELLNHKQRLYDFQVTAAASLEEANKFINQGEFDIVLLDLGLSDSSGLCTLSSFSTEQSQLPTIVLTGLNDEEIAFQAVQQGAQDFLVKGEFDGNLLRRSIRYSIERHRLEQERISLSSQLLSVLDDEQQRISRELHDEVGQGLSGVNMMVGSLARKLRGQSLDHSKKAMMISEGIQDILDSFRRVLCGLNPVDVDVQGLPVALQRLCDAINSQSDNDFCIFECAEGLSVADNNIATNLYRIAQESLNNSRKHADATKLRVRLVQKGDNLILHVSDDGHGFPCDDPIKSGMGLRIMRHRSELIGGILTIQSGAGGTTVQCKIQVKNET